MATYRTPGVFVEEISKFPPSVAQVETAIPAFIGYTEKAQKVNPGDLHLVPTRIGSLLEYENLFGGAPPLSINSIEIDNNNALQDFSFDMHYYMYNSLRMFFANGGGNCYIISIGLYSGGQIIKPDFDQGLGKLKKVDEPTLILFPDAVLLQNSADFYGVQQDALMQCNELKDRFCIFDLSENPDWQQGYEKFRFGIGVNNLSYGAAYTPYLRTNIQADLNFKDIYNKTNKNGNLQDFKNLTFDNQVKQTVEDFENLIGDDQKIQTGLAALRGSSGSVRAAIQQLVDDFNGNTTNTNLDSIISKIFDVIVQIDKWAHSSTTTEILAYGNLNADLQSKISGVLITEYTNLVKYEKGAKTKYSTSTLYDTNAGLAALNFDIATWGDPANIVADDSIFTSNPQDDNEERKNALTHILSIFSKIENELTFLVDSANNYHGILEKSLFDTHLVYKNLIVSLKSQTAVLPPSGAIAGIFAFVDGNRGVWKAPANVSLNGVVSLTETIDNSEQDLLNVDTTAGKSINAIRAFTGKGTLVWGARTLDGNSNEWRYVPVRRLFIMVEESVKKATERFVFEPNDQNTWVQVRTMIENYLVGLWQQGALAGAKPEQAFYVAVGLKETMTPQDILEGRMIIEIGMAAVRPAEFIILRFSHKMQES